MLIASSCDDIVDDMTEDANDIKENGVINLAM
jgi:hypothetical protein